MLGRHGDGDFLPGTSMPSGKLDSKIICTKCTCEEYEPKEDLELQWQLNQGETVMDFSDVQNIFVGIMVGSAALGLIVGIYDVFWKDCPVTFATLLGKEWEPWAHEITM